LRQAEQAGLAAVLTNAVALLGLHRLKGVHPWAIVAHYSVLASWAVGSPPGTPPQHQKNHRRTVPKAEGQGQVS
jgi:hypothetical protein